MASYRSYLHLIGSSVSSTYRWRRIVSALAVFLALSLTVRRLCATPLAQPLLFTGPDKVQTGGLFPIVSQGCVSSGESSSPNMTLACESFPHALLSKVQVVIKTGSAQAKSTEVLLNTMASCISNAIVVSDAQGVLAGHAVHNVLAMLPTSYANDNPDWDSYGEQLNSSDGETVIGKSHEGWKLDRFKFLPMIELAFEMAPGADWYFFIEDDIYIFWDTLFRFLTTIDPNEYFYIGPSIPGSRGIFFAYGGGGIVMSRKLVHDILRGGRQNISVKYEKMIKDDCCGDAALGYVIYDEVRHRLNAPFPTFTGEESTWLRVGRHNWHTPLMGLHHVSSEEMKALWEWDRCRHAGSDLTTHADFIEYGLRPLAEQGALADWDNRPDQSLPAGDVGHLTAKACESACTDNSTCLQYRHSPETGCSISSWVCIGQKIDDMTRNYTSGWNLTRLAEMGFQDDEDGLDLQSE